MEQQQMMQLQRALKADLEHLIPSLQSVVPKHVTPERLVKVVLSATARQPDLLQCTRTSIVRSLMQAGELGLEIGGLLGEAYLVPFNVKIREQGKPDRWEKQATCIVGYRGFLKLARQSGYIDSISARVVYQGELFEVDLANETVSHKLQLDVAREDKNIVAAYAIARLKGGITQIDVMSRREVDAIRARSKSGDNGPWLTDYGEMARKTVVRRLYKYLPVSTELQRALEVDAETDPIIANVVSDLTTSAQANGLPAVGAGAADVAHDADGVLIGAPPEEEPKPAAPRRARGVAERVRQKGEADAAAAASSSTAQPAQQPQQAAPPSTATATAATRERKPQEQQSFIPSAAPATTSPQSATARPARQELPEHMKGDAWEGPDEGDVEPDLGP